MSSSTSCSRGVRASMRVGGATAGRRAKSSISRRVTDGASSASPAATTRTACTRILAADVLQQEAAGAGPQRVEHVLVEVERREDDHLHRVVHVGSGDAPGRLDAVAAGHADVHEHDVGAERERATSTASRPSAASPTTARSGCASTIIVKPLRTSSWSSATTTRTGAAPVVPRAHGPSGRRARTRNPPPARGPASSVPPSTPTRSRIPTSPSPVDRRRGHRRAVVGDGDEQRVVVDSDVDLGPGGAGRVAQDVGQRLLDDPVGREADDRVDRRDRLRRGAA